MAKNDMMVIVYKTLKYMYDINRNNKVPTFTDMYRALELSEGSSQYFGRIVQELIDKGYIAGCIVQETKSGTLISIDEGSRITLDGVQFLEENSGVQKGKQLAGKAFAVLLEAVVSAAMNMR